MQRRLACLIACFVSVVGRGVVMMLVADVMTYSEVQLYCVWPRTKIVGRVGGWVFRTCLESRLRTRASLYCSTLDFYNGIFVFAM
jgi:hypothetical protein